MIVDLEGLAGAAGPEETVGIGLVRGDLRESEVVRRAVFCKLRIFREAGTLLDSLEKGKISAASRGSLPAGPFLSALKERTGVANVRRIAMLQLPGGRPFLLGPVGIDEGRTLSDALALVEDSKAFCALLGWEPRVAVLSAGRPEDAARGRDIARSIRRGERLSGISGVRHFHIAIEEAISWGNCLVAPDGVTGNLIYRTLVHLGSGASLGALYFPLLLHLADTSRSGTVEEYLGAIALANLAAMGSNS